MKTVCFMLDYGVFILNNGHGRTEILSRGHSQQSMKECQRSTYPFIKDVNYLNSKRNI